MVDDEHNQYKTDEPRCSGKDRVVGKGIWFHRFLKLRIRKKKANNDRKKNSAVPYAKIVTIKTKKPCKQESLQGLICAFCVSDEIRTHIIRTGI